MNAVVATENHLASLGSDKLSALERLAEGLGPAELYWLAAWSAAKADRLQRGLVDPPLAAGKAQGDRLTILYGSQTGQAKRIAAQLSARAEAAGLSVRLVRADGYAQRDLAKETHLAVVISTQGDAEPPDDARGLVEFLLGKRAPKLPGLRYTVLGLGDSSYPQFCAIGRQIDARLEELGAKRFAPFGEADVDVDAVAAPWAEGALEQARQLLGSAQPTVRVANLQPVPSRVVYTRERPFAASVLDNQPIVARDAGRDVRHVELSLEGSGLHYEPGDAIGVWPENPPALVDQWLSLLSLDGGQAVRHDGKELPLRQWLTHERELTRLSRPLIAAVADASGDEKLAGLLRPDRSASLAALLASDQPIDLWRRHPARWSAEELVATLRPQTPRLYSIASSQKAVGDEVHLTVALVDYEAYGERHWGAASSFVAAAGDDHRVPVFIEENERFRLPKDSARDIIMIGPGTGVAPFRAFVQERRETGAGGRNWLFFGNRHFTRDFLYQIEWQAALRDGSLQKLDLAFSRDGDAKVYVQQRIREQGRELYDWLQDGAHLYVCGDASQMAKDVHAALIDVAITHGGQSPDQAKEWLSDLLQQGRYARDVY
ncbi:assimilatory sulfite reductase (NADPH) flavoprotein subunit [Dyella solisilvae]|uniref:Sulfite reductase [NADPH] flavoprotein alpha-component n=1 Tax=Dyella solisilvae TaxID=1920168 RepID=A0A370KBW9_9GAMM|nr:assimilatory sulfite reductase (NADPH) flavoprotein subunit [Dyella solisilvae]RDI99580.1 assimilatory sulfite reductase (NADPH) flavoprotein subunit [Dyella solisilvae]